MRRTGAEPYRVLNESTLDFCEQRWHALIVERNLAADEHVEDYAETPDVDLGTSVDIAWGSSGAGKISSVAL